MYRPSIYYDPDLSGNDTYDQYDLYDLAHVAGREPHFLHDLELVFSVGYVL